MPTPPLLNDASPGIARPFADPRGLRGLWAVEQNPQLVRLVQSTTGRLVLVALFVAVARPLGVSLPYVLAAAACAYLPTWRTAILIAAAVASLARSSEIWLVNIATVLAREGLSPSTGRWVAFTALGVFFALAWAALAQVRRHPGGWLARRPVVCMLWVAAGLCALASWPQLHGLARVAIWSFLVIFGTYLWYVAYAVQDQRTRAHGSLPLQMGLLQPFWRSAAMSYTPTPFGKGAAFLRRHQARTDEELAVTQLKALKLLVWTAILFALQRVLVDLIEVRLELPRASAIYEAFMRGKPYPGAINWASLVWGTLGGTLSLAIWGHKIIAVARLAGFRLPRNTWRPLEARTLAEFWNRYYYYFKELLVEFFFFPTFLRSFRKHPRLRVFFATFMAAGVGNSVYHFVRDIQYVATMGWHDAAAGFTSYLFYSAVLATGIGISQARANAGYKPRDTWTGVLCSVLCVWFFFICLQVFGDETRSFPFSDRVAFFLSLFGIQR